MKPVVQKRVEISQKRDCCIIEKIDELSISNEKLYRAPEVFKVEKNVAKVDFPIFVLKNIIVWAFEVKLGAESFQI